MPNPGIGASGQIGIAPEVLAPPVQIAGTPSITGGTLADGTYRYYVTGLNTYGETTVSNEITTVLTGGGGSGKIAVNWNALTGATGYKIYRTAAGGASGTELLIATVGVVTTYDDTGSVVPAGAYPTVNTAATPGTYAAPVKFFPFNTESLQYQQTKTWRRGIRKSADPIGVVAGDAHIEGDIEMEALEDVVAHFLYASRALITKTGTVNYTYVATGTADAIPKRTLSITVERNGQIFAYVGCVVGSYKFTITDGVLMFTVSIVGQNELTQAIPTPSFTTVVPFGAGQYSIQFPTATQVFDTDTFEWTCEDSAEAQYRMKDTGVSAQFVKFGERTVSLTCERDFLDKTDYNAFKSVTSQSVTILATKGVNNQIELLTPVSTKDTYEVTNAGQGDLVRASIAYQTTIDGTGKAYQVTVKTQENVL